MAYGIAARLSDGKGEFVAAVRAYADDGEDVVQY